MQVAPRPVSVGRMSGELHRRRPTGSKTASGWWSPGVSFLRDGMKVRLMPEKEQATAVKQATRVHARSDPR